METSAKVKDGAVIARSEKRLSNLAFPGFVGAGLAPAQGNRKACPYTRDCFVSLAMTLCGIFIRFLVLLQSSQMD